MNANCDESAIDTRSKLAQMNALLKWLLIITIQSIKDAVFYLPLALISLKCPLTDFWATADITTLLRAAEGLTMVAF